MPHEAPPRNSDDYAATLLAVGPGVLACAIFAMLETGFRSWPSFGFAFPPSAYAAVLFGFLPGLPTFGYCLSRAIPRSAGIPSLTIYLPWLLACPLGLTWHFVVIDLSFRMWQVESPVDWLLVVRYSICLSVVTSALWTVHAVRKM